MNSKVDMLVNARRNNIQITYPVNDRNNCITLLDNQRENITDPQINANENQKQNFQDQEKQIQSTDKSMVK